MKNTKLLSTLLAFFLMTGISMAKPDEKTQSQKNLSFCIDTYIQVLKSGYTANYAAIISSDAKFNMNRNGKMFSYGRSEELAFVKKQSFKQNCEITQRIITANESYALINVSMQYPDFTRENIVTMSKENGLWKIKEVNTIFK